MKITLVDCSHELCYDCLYEIIQTSDDCLQCKDSKKDLNMEKPEDKTLERDAECSICLGEKQNKAMVGSCFHSFCFKCITDWSKTARECPLCRNVFSEIYHDIKDDNTFETFRLKRPWTNEGTSPFSTDYSDIFNTEEAHLRLNRLLDKMRNRNRGDYRIEHDHHDNRIVRNEPVRTFWHVAQNRSVVQNNDSRPKDSDLLRHQDTRRGARRRDDRGDISAARSSRPNLLGSSMETGQSGPSFKEFFGERSFRRRTSSDSEDSSVIQNTSRVPLTRQSQAATRTKQVRFTVRHRAPEEQLASEEATMPNSTPRVRRVFENNSSERRKTVKLSKRSPTRRPRRLSNGSESGDRNGTTTRTSPNPSHLNDDDGVKGNPEIPQEPVSSSNDGLRQAFLNRFIQFTNKAKCFYTGIKNNKL